MQNKIILASKSKVRKEILDKNNIESTVESSNVDEDIVKLSLLKEKASPEIISKNLAELKANKVSTKKNDEVVLGADSVIDLDGELISKPENREEAMKILEKLNGKSHFLISSVCISKNGSMIWNYTDKAVLTMKNMTNEDLKQYLSKKVLAAVSSASEKENCSAAASTSKIIRSAYSSSAICGLSSALKKYSKTRFSPDSMTAKLASFTVMAASW